MLSNTTECSHQFWVIKLSAIFCGFAIARWLEMSSAILLAFANNYKEETLELGPTPTLVVLTGLWDSSGIKSSSLFLCFVFT